MELVRLESLSPRAWAAPSVTLGNFDGVHLGHQALVVETVAQARALAGTAIVLTFDPHPARVVSPERAHAALMTVGQKAEVLAALGVDRLAVLPFTEPLSRESPEEFARIVLHGALRAQVVVVGQGFRFGHGRTGDVPALVRLGMALGFDVRAIAPVWHEGAPVSSSRIRDLLGRGEVKAARGLLGRRFFVDGEVVRGAGRGRTLGIPTANVAPRNETLPLVGVYACWVRPGPLASLVPAVANLGRRPTFGGGELTLEVHLLDFDGDLYGIDVRVEFEERLRYEHAFAGVAPLLDQVRADIQAARAVLEKP